MIKAIFFLIEKHATKLMYCILAITSILYATLSLLHHTHFLSGGFDLGIYDQELWQFAHFIYPFNSVKDKLIFGDHLSLSMIFLSPLYWIWDDVRFLLFFQAIWVSMSALPVYFYLKRRGFTNIISLVLATIYLYFFGIQYAVYFDFHPIIIGVGLLAWVLFFWESERWKLFWITIAVSFLTQENMGIGIFGLCMLWLFQKKRIRMVLFLAAASVVVTGLSFFLIHFLSQGHLEYSPSLPNSPLQFITEFFDAGDKRLSLLYSFSWYSFLPLLSPGALLAVAVDLAQYFITGNGYDRMWSPFMHHRAILSIFLLVGAADVLLFLRSKKIPITLVVFCMLLVAFFFQFHFHFAVNKLAKRDYVQEEQWMKDNNIMLSHVPKGASVAAQQSLVPHLTHRNDIYLIYPRKRAFKTPVCSQDECWWLEWAKSPDYVVVDTHDSVWVTMLLAQRNEFLEAIMNMEKAQVLSLWYKKGEAKIYIVNKAKLKNFY